MSDITTAARRVAAAMSRAEAGVTIGFDQEGNRVDVDGAFLAVIPRGDKVTQREAQDLLDNAGGQVQEGDDGDVRSEIVTSTETLLNRLCVANRIEKAAKKMSDQTRSELSGGDHLHPGDRRTVNLPDGTRIGSVTRRELTTKTVYEVVDPEAFALWAQVAMPSSVREEVLDPADPEVVELVKKHLPDKVGPVAAPHLKTSLKEIVAAKGQLPAGVKAHEETSGGAIVVNSPKATEKEALLGIITPATIRSLIGS